jgi:hypothetical protein
MPQRQTYPHIRGSASDEVDLLPLEDADDLELQLEIVDGDLFVLPAVALNPTETFILDDVEYQANFEAPIGASGLSTDVTELRGKLKVTWDASATPPLVQFVPQVGFITVSITENIQSDA